MLHVLLARHGETEWNSQGRLQGQTDIPLNEVGRSQALRLAERLRGVHLDAIYASHLARARETAMLIADGHAEPVPIRIEPILREVNYGDFQGLTDAQIQAKYPDVYPRWQPKRVAAPPNGETTAQLAARMDAFLRILLNSVDQTVLVVSHGEAMQMLLCRVQQRPAADYWQVALPRNAELLELTPAADSTVRLYSPDAGTTASP